MMSKAPGFFAIFLATALFLGGCASGATAAGMTVKAADIKAPASPEVASSVGVTEVVGGEETDSMGASQIGNPEFKKALVRSLRAAGLLSADPNPKYVVSADLVGLKQPVAAFNMTVTSRVRYTLKESKSGLVIFNEEVVAQFTAKPSDSLIGFQRLRMANEGSARKSIAALIEKLNAAGATVGKSAAPAPAPVLMTATHTL